MPLISFKAVQKAEKKHHKKAKKDKKERKSRGDRKTKKDKQPTTLAVTISMDQRRSKHEPKRHPGAKEAHVDVFAEFTGTVSPTGPNYVAENSEEINARANNACDYDFHWGDGEALVSAEMMRPFRQLIRRRRIHWHWLSYDWAYAPRFDEALHIAHAYTSNDQMINSSDDKRRRIVKAIKHAGRHDVRQDIVWIDRDFGPDDSFWPTTLDRVDRAKIALLKVTVTECCLGKEDVATIREFISRVAPVDGKRPLKKGVYFYPWIKKPWTPVSMADLERIHDLRRQP